MLKMPNYEDIDGPPSRVAIATLALSVFCLAIVGVFVPTMMNRLENASWDIEQRMGAFKASFLNKNSLYYFSLLRVAFGKTFWS
jgi:hypothetical protein